jgi:hypothetical protein
MPDSDMVMVTLADEVHALDRKKHLLAVRRELMRIMGYGTWRELVEAEHALIWQQEHKQYGRR